jgi:hypothetical protein
MPRATPAQAVGSSVRAPPPTTGSTRRPHRGRFAFRAPAEDCGRSSPLPRMRERPPVPRPIDFPPRRGPWPIPQARAAWRSPSSRHFSSPSAWPNSARPTGSLPAPGPIQHLHERHRVHPGIGVAPIRFEPLQVGVNGPPEQRSRFHAALFLGVLPTVLVHSAEQPIGLAGGPELPR